METDTHIMDETAASRARFEAQKQREKEIREIYVKSLPWTKKWMYVSVGDILQGTVGRVRKVGRYVIGKPYKH